MTFKEIYDTRPDQKNKGSSDKHRLRLLYLLCRLIKPELIIESGVWKGNSLHLFMHTCPDALVMGFDINLDNLKIPIPFYKNIASIKLFNHDWNEYLFTRIPDRHLIYFDDHVNQFRRLWEAHERGFKYLVFDDNIFPGLLHKYKNPPLPTLECCFIKPWVERYKMFPDRTKEKDTYITYVEL
jgi:hypothetical protein